MAQRSLQPNRPRYRQGPGGLVHRVLVRCIPPGPALSEAADDVVGSSNYGVVFGHDQRFYQPNDWKGSLDASTYLQGLKGVGYALSGRAYGVLADRAPRFAE